MYHQKQSKMLCALHALNNLFQDANGFSQAELENIALELDQKSLINPHKFMFGLGNYDVNVIILALEKRQHELVWYNRVQTPAQNLNLDNIVGFIVNCEKPPVFLGIGIPFYKGRHWYSIRKFQFDEGPLQNGYYDLDSNLNEPRFIGDDNALRTYLEFLLQSELQYVFIVVAKPAYDSGEWIHKVTNNNSGTTT